MTALLQPRMLVVHLIGIIALVVAGGLGWWQYDAWSDNRHDKSAEIAAEEPVPLQDVIGADDPFPTAGVGRPVSFEGQWDSARTQVIDNQTTNGEVERWVVTPVIVGDSAMLVVRGRQADADPSPVAGRVLVTGWLQPGGTARQGVRVADFLQEVETDLYSAYVIAKTPADSALEPITPSQLPKPSTFTSIRNLLYAIEWWVFGGFAVFIWWRWCRDEVRRTKVTEVAPAE